MEDHPERKAAKVVSFARLDASAKPLVLTEEDRAMEARMQAVLAVIRERGITIDWAAVERLRAEHRA